MVSPLPADLWAAARRDLLALFGYIENADVRLAGRALLGLSGGPTADFNMALIDDDGDALSQFADRVTKAGVPTTFMLSSACAARLRPIAKAKGLMEVGNAPLMALQVGPKPSPLAGEVAPHQAFPSGSPRSWRAGEPGADVQARHFSIEHATNEKSLGAVADLVAAAFELDREWVGRTFCSNTLLDSPTLSFFLALKGGEPYSAVTTTAGRSTVGIWSMATSPNHLRQGAGRAALLAAMEHHRKLGATTFYLIATPAGKPLYDSVGFATVDEFPIWVAAGSGP